MYMPQRQQKRGKFVDIKHNHGVCEKANVVRVPHRLQRGLFRTGHFLHTTGQAVSAGVWANSSVLEVIGSGWEACVPMWTACKKRVACSRVGVGAHFVFRSAFCQYFVMASMKLVEGGLAWPQISPGIASLPTHPACICSRLCAKSIFITPSFVKGCPTISLLRTNGHQRRIYNF